MLKGIPVSPGWGFGRAVGLSQESEGHEPTEEFILPEDVDRELDRLERAVVEVEKDLKNLANRLGPEEREIFTAQALLLRDPEYYDRIIEKIKVKHYGARAAVRSVGEEVAGLFSGLEDEYLRQREADIRDITERLLGALSGSRKDLGSIPAKAVIIAEELQPSLAAQLSDLEVAGVVTERGGSMGHAAIVLRSLGIPAVFGIKNVRELIKEDDEVLVDGIRGVVYINPSPSMVAVYQKNFDRTDILARRALPAVTRDGYHLAIGANIGHRSEVEQVRECGAEGVGLFRTEFLFLDREEAPEEAEQYLLYREVMETLNEWPVIFRTLDLGGDKLPKYLTINREDNPFLGVRGLRLALQYPEIFKVQLKALVRASRDTKVPLRIMFPMVTSIAEVREARRLLLEVIKLVGEPAALEVGIMIEVPAAALKAGLFAQEVDFFSLGTNDLTQYTMAADRGNEGVAHLCDPYDPAVLRLIRWCVREAHKYGRWVGICGELAGEVLATPLLVGLELDELSMSPAFVPEVKEKVRSIMRQEAVKLADQLLELSSGEEVRERLAELPL